jgi:ferredoxin
VKVAVDSEICAGHGNCTAICPDVFDLTDDGYAVVITADVPAEHEDTVRDAVAQCPERAVSFAE